jgi:hypothetical protein
MIPPAPLLSECDRGPTLPEFGDAAQFFGVAKPAPRIAAATDALTLSKAPDLGLANASHPFSAMRAEMIAPNVPGA